MAKKQNTSYYGLDQLLANPEMYIGSIVDYADQALKNLNKIKKTSGQYFDFGTYNLLDQEDVKAMSFDLNRLLLPNELNQAKEDIGTLLNIPNEYQQLVNSWSKLKGTLKDKSFWIDFKNRPSYDILDQMMNGKIHFNHYANYWDNKKEFIIGWFSDLKNALNSNKSKSAKKSQDSINLEHALQAYVDAWKLVHTVVDKIGNNYKDNPDVQNLVKEVGSSYPMEEAWNDPLEWTYEDSNFAKLLKEIE